MKRILSVACAVIALLLAITVFTSCGGDPHYYIGNLSYDPVSKVLDWADSSDAKEWIVTINGEEFTTSISQLNYDAQNQNLQVRIEGLHDKKGSDINPVLNTTIYYLETPTGLRVENGKLLWDPVINANGYEIYNNGVYQGTEYGCSYGIPAGAFNLSVKAIRSDYYYGYASESLGGVILASPNYIEYNNGVFTWNVVDGADYYDLVINGESFKANTNSYTYVGNKEDIEISVSAGANAEGSYVSAPLTQTCYYLAPVTEFSFDENGNLTWKEVANASYYEVNLNGESVGTVSTALYSGLAENVYYTVVVTPVGEFSYTDTAIPYSFEKLSPVTGVKFSDGVITWDYHSKASSYEVKINDQIKTATDNSYEVGNIEYSITIEVYALGSKENSRSYMAYAETYNYLPRVTGLTVVDGELIWNASEGAVSYTIRFSNGSTQSVAEPKFTNITPNTQYVAQVIPVGPNATYYSYWSQEIDFKVLAAPTLTFNQGVFSWQGINDADGYVFRVTMPDGTVKDTTLAKNKYVQNCDFITTPGKYTVAVKILASSANENLYDSAYSKAMNVVQLADVNGHKINNSATNSETFSFAANAVDYAVGYKVYINGTEKASQTSGTFNLDLTSLLTDDGETTFKVEVLAIGKVTSTDIILDAKNKYAFNVTKLATPKNVKINGTTITWDDVNNASKYLISIDGQTFESSTSSYKLSNVSAGKHTVTVRALATSDKYMSSRWSTALSFEKLPQPGNVRIEPANNDTIVRWDAVNGAKGYEIKVGSSNAEPVGSTAFNVSKHVSALGAGEGVQISVYAKGNGSTILDSEPSKTITIARLAAPTNIAISGDNITWNASEVDGIKATSYELYLNGEKIAVAGTSYSVAELEAGQYTIYVKALGNRTSTVDSPDSGSIVVTKLPEITNVQMADGGQSYTWDMVGGATYEVTINNNVYYTSEAKFDVNNVFTGAGVYTVSIRAISTDPYTMPGKANTFKQTVSALATPMYVADADIFNMADNTFTITQDGQYFTVVAKANGALPVSYEFYVDGISCEATGDSYTHQMSVGVSGWKYNVQVRFKVSGFAGGTYYVDSAISAEATVVEP